MYTITDGNGRSMVFVSMQEAVPFVLRYIHGNLRGHMSSEDKRIAVLDMLGEFSVEDNNGNIFRLNSRLDLIAA